MNSCGGRWDCWSKSDSRFSPAVGEGASAGDNGAHIEMTMSDHIVKAKSFLDESDRKFAEGECLRASARLWDAATRSVIAVARKRGWDYSNPDALKDAAIRLAGELELSDKSAMRGGLALAERFPRNIHHNYMEGFDIEADRADVHRFVSRMLELLGWDISTGGGSRSGA